MILIGSRALVLRVPNLLRRKPVDFDFVCTEEECNGWLDKNKDKIGLTSRENIGNKVIARGEINCEFSLIRPGTSNELLLNLVLQDYIPTPFGMIPNLDLLFTLKTSHRYLKDSPHFWKNLSDWHLMRAIGAEVRPQYQEFLKIREKETYTYKHPKLNVNKQQFFADDQITYVFEHDDIHESVKLLDRPAYQYYMKDDSEVFSDKAKFFACSKEIRIAGVIEEAATLAIERSLVPHPGVWTPEFAWKFALSKVCTSITSGFFREFAYENVPEILKQYPSNYWTKFQKDVNAGHVRYLNK